MQWSFFNTKVSSSLKLKQTLRCQKQTTCFTFLLHTILYQQVHALPGGEGKWRYFEVHNSGDYINSFIDKRIKTDELPEDWLWLGRECRLKDPDNKQRIIYFAGNSRINLPGVLYFTGSRPGKFQMPASYLLTSAITIFVHWLSLF